MGERAAVERSYDGALGWARAQGGERGLASPRASAELLHAQRQDTAPAMAVVTRGGESG